MKRMGRLAIALAIAWSATAAPVSAKQATSVSLPFKPPLGKVLHFRVEYVVTNDLGRGPTTWVDTVNEEEVVFTDRTDDGFEMHWTITSVSDQVAAPRSTWAELLPKAMVGKTVIIQTDTNGYPMTALNAEELRTALIATFSTEAAASEATPEATPNGIAKDDSIAAMYRNATEAALDRILLAKLLMVYGLSGSPLTPGKPTVWEGETLFPASNTTMKYVSQTELRSIDERQAIVAVTASSDPDEIKAMTLAHMEKTAEKSGDAIDKASVDVAKASNAITMRTERVVTLDRKTGMIGGARYRKELGVDGRTRTEETTFTFLD